MSAYIIVNVDVKDPTLYEEYRKLVPASIEKYGGKFVARGGKHEVLEGEWQPNRLVILEFPSYDQAQAWYHSEEYREPKAMRFNAANAELVIVEGL